MAVGFLSDATYYQNRAQVFLDMGPERFASPAPIFWFTEAVGNECCGLQNVKQFMSSVSVELDATRQPSSSPNSH